MNNKKNCPQCNKQLPVTASNCKYCGASLQDDKQPSIFDSFGHLGHPSKTAPLPILKPGGGISSMPPRPPSIPPRPPSIPSRPPSMPPNPPSIPPNRPSAPPKPSVAPAAPPAAPVVDESPSATDGGWIPDADEASELINLSGDDEASELINLSGDDEASELINLSGDNEASELINLSGDDEASELINLSGDDEASELIDLSAMDDTDFEEPPTPSSDDQTVVKAMSEIDLEQTSAESVPKSEMETAARRVSIPPSSPRASVPSPVLPVRPSVPSFGPSALSSKPVIPNSPSMNPAALGATESIGTSQPQYAVDTQSDIPENLKDTAERLSPVGLSSRPSQLGKKLSAMESGLSTKKVVIISVFAFALTLAVALGIMFATTEPHKIEVVDSSSLEPNSGTPPTSTAIPKRNKQLDPQVTEPTATSPVQEEPPIASNCLPISRYYGKFPWKKELETLLEKKGSNKVCELFGTDPSVVASAYEGETMVGPTGYDWIIDGGRIEMYPKGTVGAREPSMEFMYAKGKLFKIKLKYRDLRINRFAGPKTLQKIFKKENTQTDHLGRNATIFDEQDMKVVLIEEEWYGQTLRTLEFTSVALNKELGGHIKKLESLESVYKQAETAYFGWKFDEALQKYEEVSSMAPEIGAALVKQGLIYLRNDNFGEARKRAEEALAISKEDDVKAEAQGILAVNSLRNGDPKKALDMLREALNLSPATERFSSTITQIESGEYSTQNIAQTAARLECIKKRKSEASEIGVLARGFFPDKATYQKNLKRVFRTKDFKTTKKNLMDWECK